MKLCRVEVLGGAESMTCGTCGTPDCTWIEYPNNPVYEPVTKAYYQTVRYDQTGFAPYGPSAFYKMWYDYASTGGLAMATSPDGINWSFNSNMTGLTETARHSRVIPLWGIDARRDGSLSY